MLAIALVGGVSDTIKYNIGMAKIRREHAPKEAESREKADWSLKASDLKGHRRRTLDITIPGVDTTLTVSDTTLLKITTYTINVRSE